MFVDRSGVAIKENKVGTGAGNAPGAISLDLGVLAPAGYFMALRVGFAVPVEEVNAFPCPWIDLYNQRGFMVFDPVMRWIFDGDGHCRWSAIPFGDPRGVFAAAREHGLHFGAAVSIRDRNPRGQRSFANFARADREFTDQELDLLLGHLRARHAALAPPANLTMAELEALRLIKDGQRLKQIAHQLGVTEGAVKQRLKNARLKLSAKTGAEAISRAAAFGLI